MKAKTSCKMKLSKDEVDVLYNAIQNTNTDDLDNEECLFLDKLAETICGNGVTIIATIEDNKFIDY